MNALPFSRSKGLVQPATIAVRFDRPKVVLEFNYQLDYSRW